MAGAGNRLSPRAAAWLWGGSGLALLGVCAVLAWLAQDFTYGSDMGTRPVMLFVLILSGAGCFYLGVSALIARTEPTRRLAWWVFAAGAGMRLVMSLSQPILEDDWYRYLWDGAVTAHGLNPYTVIPITMQGDCASVEGAASALADEAGIILERVNHPELGTIYPPVAQAAFAVAHWIAPWQVSGLRVLYFATDCVVFALLIQLLLQLGRSPFYAAIYWWNPLLLKECYNSLHMDLLVAPFLLGALLLLFRKRAVLAAAMLAGAVAVKLWPVLLLPPLLATQWRRPRKLLAAGAVFLLVAVLLLAPMAALAPLGRDSGLVAYGQRWEMNDALFMVFPWLVSQAAEFLGVDLSAGVVHRVGRGIAAAIVAAVSLYASFAIARRARNLSGPAWGGDRVESQYSTDWWCWIAAVLFLVSPTQFPWYLLWLLPFLSLVPGFALLTLTALLPIYYLKFFFDARGQVDFFHYRLVWLEFGPVWALLAYEGLRKRAAREIFSGRGVQEHS